MMTLTFCLKHLRFLSICSSHQPIITMHWWWIKNSCSMNWKVHKSHKSPHFNKLYPKGNMFSSVNYILWTICSKTTPKSIISGPSKKISSTKSLPSHKNLIINLNKPSSTLSSKHYTKEKTNSSSPYWSKIAATITPGITGSGWSHVLGKFKKNSNGLMIWLRIRRRKVL